MSRSFKKIPIIKDSGNKSLYRRIYRRKVKQLVNYYVKCYQEVIEYEEVLIYMFPNGVGIYSIIGNKLDEIPHFPSRKEVIDSIDIYDWHKYKPGDPKSFRK